MRKFFLLFSIIMFFLFPVCQKSQNVTATVDDNGLEVEVIFSKELVGDVRQEELDLDNTDEYVAKKNNDGSITILMSRRKHSELLKDSTEQLEKMVLSLNSNSYSSITSLKIKSDEEVEVLVNKSSYMLGNDNMGILGFAMVFAINQAIEGNSPDEINIRINVMDNDTQELISSNVYPEFLKDIE